MKMKMANDVLVVEVEESMATVTDILVEAFQAAAVAASSSRQDALLTAVVVAAAAASVVVVVVVAAVKARKQKEVPAACRNVCRMVQTLHRRLARDIQMEEGSRNLEDHAKAKERKRDGHSFRSTLEAQTRRLSYQHSHYWPRRRRRHSRTLDCQNRCKS